MIKRNIKRWGKGAIFALTFVSGVVFIIYTLAWFALTKQIEAHIHQIVDEKLVTVTGELPKFSGYPSVPEARFSGTVTHESGLLIVIPQLNYTGFPTVGQVQTFEAPEGLKISADFLERNLNFDYAYLQLRLPYSFPASNKIENVKVWQKSNQPFHIRQILLKSGKIYARGDGTVSLDEDLQIEATINARVVGMDILFDEMAVEQGERAIIIARKFFDMISQVDEKTGEKYFETTLKIQKQGIFFGPMRISGLPKLVWK